MKLKPYSITDHTNNIDAAVYAASEIRAVEAYFEAIREDEDVTVELDYNFDFSECNKETVIFS